MRVPLLYGNKKEDKKLSQRKSNGAMDQCRVPLRDIQQLQKLEVALHDQIQGKVETNTFCHQIPKLFQEKGETVSDFAKRCITEM
jgi:hypothetical protein